MFVRSKGCVIVLFRNLRYLIKWVLIGLIVLVYRSIYLLVFCLGITLITVVTWGWRRGGWGIHPLIVSEHLAPDWWTSCFLLWCILFGRLLYLFILISNKLLHYENVCFSKWRKGVYFGNIKFQCLPGSKDSGVYSG